MIPEKVKRVLGRAGLEAVEFAEGTTPTAPMAAAALGVEVGQIAKSLLFKGKDERFYMVLCPGDRRVTNAKLKAALGVKTRMASAEETLAVTGFSPGGVCPFGVEGVDVLIDQHLARWSTIYPAAGTDGSGVPMTLAQLESLTGARVADLTEPPGSDRGP
ncbi:MAG TPA: YbaK/EbsC family protein [Kofleriaceae bacterium]|nr:YbaK/EbsC family protein [Kofleriaceae bacterium]